MVFTVSEPAVPPIESWEVLDLLASLVQKSLAVYEEDEQGQGRCRHDSPDPEEQSTVSEPPAPPPTPIEPWEVLDLLTALVQKSLVVFGEDKHGAGRYRLLETVRQRPIRRHRFRREGGGHRG